MSVNPKDVEAQTKGKVRLDLLEPAANRATAEALAFGADKYGIENYVTVPIAFRVYLAAIQRHLDALKEGEDFAPDSGAHHMGHIMANGHVFMKALEAGTLVDDRGPGALVDDEGGINRAGCIGCDEGMDLEAWDHTCPDLPMCESCPTAAEDDVCFESERPPAVVEDLDERRARNAFMAQALEHRNRADVEGVPWGGAFWNGERVDIPEQPLPEQPEFPTCPASHDEIEEFWDDAGRPEEKPPVRRRAVLTFGARGSEVLPS